MCVKAVRVGVQLVAVVIGLIEAGSREERDLDRGAQHPHPVEPVAPGQTPSGCPSTPPRGLRALLLAGQQRLAGLRILAQHAGTARARR